MGVTVLAASGSDGVSGSNVGCGYFPSFPATNPYVTAVGGTMGAGGNFPASMAQEVANQGFYQSSNTPVPGTTTTGKQEMAVTNIAYCRGA